MSNIYIKISMIAKPFSKLLILLLFLSLYSCKKSSISKENSEHIESRENLTHDEQEWVLLKYSDGTYGAEINDKIILSNYENKIYLMGYSGDYVFKTQKGEDWLFYNLSGELLFTIPNAKHATLIGYSSDSDKQQLQNAYILVEDYKGKESVYGLDGKMIIEPLNTYGTGISEILVNLDSNKLAIWGFKASIDSNTDVIYNYDGELVLSGKSIVKENKGACPIFLVEKSDSYVLYNYKGEKIINTDEYSDYGVCDEDNYGYSYIVCVTEYAREQYYEESDMLWISMNGEVLKEEGSKNIDYDVKSKDRSELNRVKDNIRNRINKIPRFNKSSSSIDYNTESDNYIDSNNYPSYNDNSNNMDYNTPIMVSSEDNSRWDSYYRENYNRYAKLVETHLSTLNTFVSTGNGGATSSYAISEAKSSIREAQSNMVRLRNEAQQKGIYIDASPLENVSY